MTQITKLSKKTPTLISLIISCYNEEKSIPVMYQRVNAVFQKLQDYEFEIIYVDNVSTDNSRTVLEQLAKKDKRVKVIFMSRNTGSPQPSFIAGMSYARGKGTFLIHGDIQDSPELIPTFLEKWKTGYDVVYGIRTHRRGYGMRWNFYYKAFYYILQKMAYIPIPLHAGEFGVMSRNVVDALLAFPEYDYNIRCLRAYVGFKQIGIPYVRENRYAGKSTVNFLAAIYTAEEMIINFSFKPLWFIVFAGIGTFLLTGLLTIADIACFLAKGYGIPGVSIGTILILFVLGLQFTSLGIIGMYLAKMFLELKGRPRYIIQNTINLPAGINNNNRLRTIVSYHHDYILKRNGIQHVSHEL